MPAVNYQHQSYSFQNMYAEYLQMLKEEEQRMTKGITRRRVEPARLNGYNGQVQIEFKPDAKRYRYKVTDLSMNTSQNVRGVTSVLRDVIHKPDLLLWPMNEALNKLFDQQYDTDTEKYSIGSAKKALLAPGGQLTEESLNEALQAARTAHTNRSDAAKDVGTIVHRAIELLVKGESKTPLRQALQENAPETKSEEYEALIPIAEKAYKAFVEWTEQHEIVIVASELPIYHRQLNYAGTVDLVAQIDGKTYVIDFKTSNRSKRAPLGVYAEYFLQLGGYYDAIRNGQDDYFVDGSTGLAVINIGKDGKINTVTNRDIGIETENCATAFAFACRLHDWLESTARLTSDSRLVSELDNKSRSE